MESELDKLAKEERYESKEFWDEISVFIERMIKKYYKKLSPNIHGEMHAAAEECAWKAVKKYDVQKGVFSTYVWAYIRGGIHTAYCKEALGLTVYFAKIRKRLLDFENTYRLENKTCTLERACRELGISPKSVLYLVNAGKLEGYGCQGVWY